MLKHISSQCMSVEVTAVYNFCELSEQQLLDIERQVLEISGLRGLLVIGSEGFNGTMSGSADVIACLKQVLNSFADSVEFKDSTAKEHPFRRLKVDRRPEIVTSTRNVSPLKDAEKVENTHLSAKEWHERLLNQPDAVVVDTRNAYEAEIGKFKGAIDPKIGKFSEFKGYAVKSDLPRDKPLYLYCTGGIRCEKAVIEMKDLGFKDVFQLEGGILKYLEQYPEGLFEGECFVFDHRVSVTNKLTPSETYQACPHCGNPGKERISCNLCDKPTVICHWCKEHDFKNSCSKNCAYHLKKKLSQKIVSG